jgi:hypothetical protein
MFLSRSLTMTYGLTLQPEEEPTQLKIRSWGDTPLSIGEFYPQVVRRRTGTGEVTFGCAADRPELRIVPAESSINTRLATREDLFPWTPLQDREGYISG